MSQKTAALKYADEGYSMKFTEAVETIRFKTRQNAKRYARKIEYCDRAKYFQFKKTLKQLKDNEYSGLNIIICINASTSMILSRREFG